MKFKVTICDLERKIVHKMLINRFQGDFMFRLSREEAKELNISQNVICSENGLGTGWLHNLPPVLMNTNI